MSKEINSKITHVKRFSWEKLAANLAGYDGFYTALMELITNAVEGAWAKNKIDPKIEIRLSEHKLVIMDNGGMTPEILEALMQNGVSLHTSANNENGVGEKIGLSFMYPVNGGHFIIVTMSEEGIWMYTSPYEDDMNMSQRDSWDYEPWAKTYLETSILNDVVPPIDEVKVELSKRLKQVIEEGTIVVFNGDRLDAYKPVGDTKPMETYHFDVFGDDVTVKVQHCHRKVFDGDKTAASTAGVTLYFNKRRISFEGCKLVPHVIGGGYFDDGVHNDFNELVTTVYVENTGDHRLPRNATKDKVDWDCKLGQKYREIIGECIKNEYHVLRKAKREAARNKKEKALEDFYGIAFSVFGQTNGGVTKRQVKLGRGINRIPDIVNFEVNDINDMRLIESYCKDSDGNPKQMLIDKALAETVRVKEIYELKEYTKIITCKEVGQLLDYLKKFKKQYGYIPNGTIVGKEIEDEAYEMCEEYKKFGYEMSFKEAIDIKEMAKALKIVYEEDAA